MDKRNKNIEDFFNKSLEQFGDAPSDKVWAGIAHRLEIDKPPFYKLWKFWARAFTGIALLFLLLWGYYSTQKAIELLTVKTSQLAEENQKLKLALNDCSVATEKMLLAKKQEIATPNSGIIAARGNQKNVDKQGIKLNKTKRNPFFIPTNFSSFENVTFSNVDLKKELIVLKPTTLFSNSPFKNNGVLSSMDTFSRQWSFPTAKKGMMDLEVAKTTEDSKQLAAAIAKSKKSGSPQLVELGANRFGIKQVNTNFKRSLPTTFVDYSPFQLIQPLKEKLRYRFGISFGGMNTFTDKKDLFGPGYNSGLTNELQFFNNVYLTAALHYNEQRYEVKLNASNQHILQGYPAVEELTNVVTSINQHAHYLELPIGLKWYFKENQKGTKFYVNPTVAWHFYFPQQFEYEQATNNGIVKKAFRNDQYFGYFGTAQMQVGLERPLFKKMHYQVGLWTEKSLIPLGVENRHLLNVGFRGAILFK